MLHTSPAVCGSLHLVFRVTVMCASQSNIFFGPAASSYVTQQLCHHPQDAPRDVWVLAMASYELWFISTPLCDCFDVQQRFTVTVVAQSGFSSGKPHGQAFRALLRSLNSSSCHSLPHTCQARADRRQESCQQSVSEQSVVQH